VSARGWRSPTRTLPGRRAQPAGHAADAVPNRSVGARSAPVAALVAIGVLAALVSGCASAAAGAAPATLAGSGTTAPGVGRVGTDRVGADPAASLLAGPAVAAAPGALLGRPALQTAVPADRATPSPPPTLWPAVPPALAALPARPPEPPRASADLAGQPAPVSAPVRVQVESLGIDMAIDPVGLADTGAMALPENPAVAAWYRYGPGPGSGAGATVVAAHVDSLVYDLGPFARLADAPAGTEIVLHTGDGAAHRYTVASIDSVEKHAVPWDGVFDRSGQPRLTLVTCGGEFDYEARRYLSNVIVTAVPVT
jgi:hypothetical protein